MSHRKIYYTFQESCTGCRICEVVCSLNHEKSGVNPALSRIRILNYPDKGIMIPEVCHLCRNAPCVTACPIGALSQNVESGVIEVDGDKCDGCGLCVEACKFGSISIHPIKNIAMACDLCSGDPLCVKYCMNKTLVFLKPEEYRSVKGSTLKDKTVPSI